MEDFVTYNQAKALKELEFDWKCIGYYTCLGNFGIEHIMPYTLDSKIICDNYNDNTISQTYNVGFSAPTFAQVQKWLREVKKEHLIVTIDRWRTDAPYYFEIYQEIGENLIRQYIQNGFQTYEQALSTGIDRALQILTDKIEKK